MVHDALEQATPARPRHKEMTMPTMYARCNWMLSLALDENGVPCRYLAKAESEPGVVEDMSNHIQRVHKIDPSDLLYNIKAVTKTVGTKPLGTRPPSPH